MEHQALTSFQQIIWDYYSAFKRNFIWRNTHNPYHIVVSEVMLQQTQTFRVAQKFEEFITQFPSFAALAQAPQSEVIKAWQGLGYNRRALALHRSAQKVIHEYSGILPATPAQLQTFPGIGKATAASICAFAFNQPTVFIETNIRTVFIHFFFPGQENISDEQLFPLVTATVNQNNPREWYYALMDYGVMLKKKFPNPSRSSAHHTQQSTFEGSDRQIRGLILKLLSQETTISFQELCAKIPRDIQRIEKILYTLCIEGFIKNENNYFTLA